MTTEILTLTEPIVNSTFTDIMTIDAFDRKGEWFIQVLFKGGATAITAATLDEVTQIEHDLKEKGWQIDQSLFHSGFNAKPKASGLCIACQLGNHCGSCSCCAGDSTPAHELGRWWTVRGDSVAIAELDEPMAYDDEELVFASGIEWPEYEYGLQEPTL